METALEHVPMVLTHTLVIELVFLAVVSLIYLLTTRQIDARRIVPVNPITMRIISHGNVCCIVRVVSFLIIRPRSVWEDVLGNGSTLDKYTITHALGYVLMDNMLINLVNYVFLTAVMTISRILSLRLAWQIAI